MYRCVRRIQEQSPTPRSFQNIPLYFEATSTKGRRLRLASVSISNRTAAGQPDVESPCPLWAPFRPSDDDGSKNPTSVGGQGGSRRERSVWVVTFVAVKTMSTRWRRVKMVEKTIRRRPVRLRKNRFTSPGSRGGWTNSNFNRWVNRSSSS
jgi:hypothetical protein